MEKRKFDLSERTIKFSKNLVDFLKKLKQTPINQPILTRLVKSGTSIGANYHEADSAESRKDFIHKLGIAKKEAGETCYWLTILGHSNPEHLREINRLESEARALLLIFNSIIKKTKESSLLDIGN